jgi:6-pyruvoyltetrahydropterin/6-carboxytetrahydropterin synthase
MYTLWKSFRFEASHELRDHDGKCRRPHGHSWVFRLFVKSAVLFYEGPQRNMVLDYSHLGRVGQEIVDLLDHYHLNALPCLVDAAGMPTSEFLARWIFEYATTKVKPNLSTWLTAVEVEETCTSGCRYEPGQ